MKETLKFFLVSAMFSFSFVLLLYALSTSQISPTKPLIYIIFLLFVYPLIWFKYDLRKRFLEDTLSITNNQISSIQMKERMKESVFLITVPIFLVIIVISILSLY